MASEKFAVVGGPTPALAGVQTVTYSSPSAGAGSDESDPRWRCCCNSMHVRTGAYVIAVSELVLSAMGVAFLLSGQAGGRGRQGTNKSGGIGHMLITILMCAFMIYGLRERKRFFLVPHMVYQILAIIGLIIISIIVMIAAAVVSSTRAVYERDNDLYREDSTAVDLAQGILIALAIFCVLIAAFEIWFFIVVLRAFRYLREVQSSSSYGSPMVSYGQTGGIN